MVQGSSSQSVKANLKNFWIINYVKKSVKQSATYIFKGRCAEK